MRKAHKLKDVYQCVADLEETLDDFAYRHALVDPVGKMVQKAVNDLCAAKVALKEATMEQVMHDLDDEGSA